MSLSMAIVLAILLVLLLLIIGEYLRRWRGHQSEMTRKFVHLTVGTFVAFWPFFLSWNVIRLLSLAFLIVVFASRYFNIFKAIHSVQRPTLGEVFFALIVGILTFVTNDRWIYAAGLLQMSLADGLAAVIGTRFGKSNSYKILRQTKSLAGTAAFFVISLIVLVAFNREAGIGLAATAMAGLALASALLENIAVFGLDNLLVPLLVAWALSSV